MFPSLLCPHVRGRVLAEIRVSLLKEGGGKKKMGEENGLEGGGRLVPGCRAIKKIPSGLR